jgi:phosphomevalonate decarboxylase
MKATAKAHPIQGLVKYHGMRDAELRLPYHDSISVCTAPSHTRTTVAFDPNAGPADDEYVIDGEQVAGRGAERIGAVLDHVRDLAGIDAAARVASENSFRSNVGFGSSSSGFAALAVAAGEAAGLEYSRPELSAIARRGSSSAARAVTGGFSQLRTGLNDVDCRSERIETGFDEDDLRIVTALVPAYKETEEAHREAADSHMFEARLAHIHGQIAEMRDALRSGSFDRTFELAERRPRTPPRTGRAGVLLRRHRGLGVREHDGRPRRGSRGRRRRLRGRNDRLGGRRAGRGPRRGRRAVLITTTRMT